jgi:hypothetical protein
MSFKMVSYRIAGRVGGTLTTTSQFVPLSATFRDGSLFMYGMQSYDPRDHESAGRTYQVVVYGDGDEVEPEFKDKFVGSVDLEDANTGAKQRLHVFCRRD